MVCLAPNKKNPRIFFGFRGLVLDQPTRAMPVLTPDSSLVLYIWRTGVRLVLGVADLKLPMFYPTVGWGSYGTAVPSSQCLNRVEVC